MYSQRESGAKILISPSLGNRGNKLTGPSCLDVANVGISLPLPLAITSYLFALSLPIIYAYDCSSLWLSLSSPFCVSLDSLDYPTPNPQRRGKMPPLRLEARTPIVASFVLSLLASTTGMPSCPFNVDITTGPGSPRDPLSQLISTTFSSLVGPGNNMNITQNPDPPLLSVFSQ